MQPKIADKDDLKTYGPERDGAIWDSVVTIIEEFKVVEKNMMDTGQASSLCVQAILMAAYGTHGSHFLEHIFNQFGGTNQEDDVNEGEAPEAIFEGSRAMRAKLAEAAATKARKSTPVSNRVTRSGGVKAESSAAAQVIAPTLMASLQDAFRPGGA